MRQYTDELGVAYSAGLADSIESFNRTMDAYLASRNTVMPMLEALIEQDPEMPMALCFRGYLLKLAADPRFAGAIRRIVASLEKTRGALTPREQQHIDALSTWAANDTVSATAIFESILATHPKDMLALRVAHYLHFYAGGSRDMCDSIARSVSVWSERDRFYGYLLGMHSFGLEESGDYAAAEATGKRAVELNDDDIWAAHAVTHVYQMQSRFEEGIPWVESLLPAWNGTNNFLYHMHWHKALCHIGAGQPDAALAIYDAHLEAALADDFYLDVCNSVSLLWRLEMLGMDVGDRWEGVLAISRARVTDDELIFSTVHYLMTAARLRDRATIETALDHFDKWAGADTSQGSLCRSVGVPLARAIVDIGEGEMQKASSALSAIQDQIQSIGGSHAQRDLFNQLREFASRQEQ